MQPEIETESTAENDGAQHNIWQQMTRQEIIDSINDGRLKWDDCAGNMGGIPDNPQAAIPSFYTQRKQGKSDAEIIADYLLTGSPASETGGSGTSIFDPVLCELAYRWFCPPAGQILDPFAGGSVRGIVASMLGRNYTGIDLSGVQIGANEQQARRICNENQPHWIVGDAVDAAALAPGDYDFIFSCPPYFDLEKYSDDPRDLSAQSWDKFLENYRTIIARCCHMLREDRFACFVVGDIRGKDGCYRGLPEETVRAFTDCGLKKYNEMILVTAVGSLGIRVGKQFGDYRKLGKTHQNVLVFLKGDWRKASAAVGPVDVSVEPMEFGELLAGQTPPSENEQGANLRLAPGQHVDLPAGFVPAQLVGDSAEKIIQRLPDDTAETIRAGLADGSLVMRPEIVGGKLVSVSVCAGDGTPMLSGAELAELANKSATPDGGERGHKGLPPVEFGGPANQESVAALLGNSPDAAEQPTTKPGGLGGEI
jgi:hypothetical protein